MKGGSYQNYRPEEKREIPVGALVNAFGRRKPDLDSFFSEDGPLAKTFPGRYQKRSSQVGLAQMVWRGLTQRLTVLSEAETGTGKSFALLGPAILWAVENNWTVLVSTATIALQDQYIRKDLPLLKEAFASIGINFSFAKAQGRSNFYCMDSKEVNDWDLQGYVEQVGDWLLSTETGDFNELPFDLKNPKLSKLHEALRADPEDCPGKKKCPFGDQCYFYRAKQAQEGAHVIVVNHALCALNDRLDGQILPAYHALMVDEAHQLERYVRSAWESTLTSKRCFKIAAKLDKAGLDGAELLDSIGKDLAHFFETYLQPFRDAPSVEWFPRKWPANWPGWLEATAPKLTDLLEDLCAHAEEIPKAAPLSSAVSELRKDLLRVTNPDQASRWFERDKQKRPVLKISPVDVSEEMAHLYKVPTVLTSATLAIGESYEFAAREMGVKTPLEMPPLKSPFDWSKNCLYVFPRRGTLTEDDLKARRGETSRQAAARWATRIAGTIKSVLERTSGRAFVLFTSKAAMEETFDLVAPFCREMGWDVLIQGEYSKGETVARFKAGNSPVLFATASFWEGVDVPGSQLSAVIIDKLPWPNPGNPIEKAKSDQLGFRGYNIPMVVRTLKQGVGRLLRTEKDRGVICILDPRVHKYPNEILAHLPGDAVAALHREGPVNVTQFLDGTGPRPAGCDLEEWAAQALLRLAGLDGDRASEENGVGFNSADTEFGNSMAEQLGRKGLTDRQWAIASNMVRKYWRQVGHPPEPSIDDLMANISEEEAA